MGKTAEYWFEVVSKRAYEVTPTSARIARFDADVAVPSGGLDELRRFSGSIEGWHNNAHMAISMADDVDMMNALTNIWLRQFWRLHFFINREFEKKLKAYGRQVTPNPMPSTVIKYLEDNFHWAVREI